MFSVTGPVTSRTSAWRGDKAQAEALEVVQHVAQRMDFQLARVARPGIDFANRQRAPESLVRRVVDARGQLGDRSLVRRRRGFGEQTLDEAFEQQSAHGAGPRGRARNTSS